MTQKFSPPPPPLANATNPICYQGIINTMRRLHQIGVTEPLLRAVLIDIRTNHPDTIYPAIERGFLRTSERWAILDTIGFIAVGRSWPRYEEGDDVLCGFLRQLHLRGPKIGVKLGVEWKAHVERAEKFCTKRRVAHLHL